MTVLSKYSDLKEKVLSLHDSDWSEKGIVNWRDYLRGIAAQDEITREDAEFLISLLPEIDFSKNDKKEDCEEYIRKGRKTAGARIAYDGDPDEEEKARNYSKINRETHITQYFDAQEEEKAGVRYGEQKKERETKISVALEESDEEKEFSSYSSKNQQKRVMSCSTVPDFDELEDISSVYKKPEKKARPQGPSVVMYDDEDFE